MIDTTVHTHPSSADLPVHEQLAWRLAEVARDPVEVEPDVTEMVINRLIDNAAVAVASVKRRPVTTAREQALTRPGLPGATVVGMPPSVRVSPEWAAWANGVAVRELDFHDTFLAADYSHPADNIPPILAVAQHKECSGAELLKGITAAYEIQVNLVKGICLHQHRIDHIAHLGPSVAAGIGSLLDLDTNVIFHAINQAVHTTTTTRQSRKGEISSWKAFAPAFAGKIAIEAVDRAMRGESSPSPIYEGEDGFIAWLLGGPDAKYAVPLPEPGEPKRAILETYTKQYSAEYQSQAFIDLAKRVRPRLDLAAVEEIVIHTSHHTHNVIGSGAGDPQKYDPQASRETLDHSLPFIFAVALQDGTWHHERSYEPARANRRDTLALWHRISTKEDPYWTRRYHAENPAERAFGGRIEITLSDGEVINEEIAVADAHPLGAKPFDRGAYLTKFYELTDGLIAKDEQRRFLDAVVRLPELSPGEVSAIALPSPVLDGSAPSTTGIL